MRGEDQEGRREGRRGREVMSKWSGLGEEGERGGGGKRSCRSGVDLARKAMMMGEEDDGGARRGEG